MTKIRVRAGDLFEVPVDDERVGYGQIMLTMQAPNMPLLAIFEPLFHRSARPSVEEITDSPILFLVNSFTKKMEDGECPVIGRIAPDPSRIVFPNFKLGRDEGVYVISYDGKRRRKATADETRSLQYRNTVSENLLARAFRAYHGLEPWDEDYERYGYQAAVEASKVGF